MVEMCYLYLQWCYSISPVTSEFLGSEEATGIIHGSKTTLQHVRSEGSRMRGAGVDFECQTGFSTSHSGRVSARSVKLETEEKTVQSLEYRDASG